MVLFYGCKVTYFFAYMQMCANIYVSLCLLLKKMGKHIYTKYNDASRSDANN